MGAVAERNMIITLFFLWALTVVSMTATSILRRVDKWACVAGCGACCKLGPLSDRPDLETYLTQDEYKTYVSMIGKDNWCVNYDKESRLCNIYDTRPEFCKVEPKKFKDMYEVDEEDMNDFCSFCCTEHISDTYGGDSPEMIKFLSVIDSLEDGEYEV